MPVPSATQPHTVVITIAHSIVTGAAYRMQYSEICSHGMKCSQFYTSFVSRGGRKLSGSKTSIEIIISTAHQQLYFAVPVCHFESRKEPRRLVYQADLASSRPWSSRLSDQRLATDRRCSKLTTQHSLAKLWACRVMMSGDGVE